MKNKIKNIMSTVFEIDEIEISDDISAGNFEKWDSLRHMNLIMALEDEFGISFSEEEMITMMSLKKILKAIDEKM